MSSCRSEYGIGAITTGEDYVLHYKAEEKFDGTSRLIICTHGRTDTAKQLIQSNMFIGRHLRALVSTGRYMVLGISAGGPTSWSNPASQTAIADALTYARARGAKSGKYGLIGYSMGGLVVWNRTKRDASNIAGAWLWNPVSDLDAAKASSTTWSNEIIASYGTYAASAGYRVADEPSTFTNLSVPVKIAHSTDDSVVPYSQSVSVLAAINNPLMTLRTPSFTGDHTGQFQNVPDAETVAFFDSLTWS